ncbi:MAG: hypothetical protein MJD61_03445 [Proteobacteria bacterium]|nr:hypothetical protein [Pseudomonadota bacterium]
MANPTRLSTRALAATLLLLGGCTGAEEIARPWDTAPVSAAAGNVATGAGAGGGAGSATGGAAGLPLGNPSGGGAAATGGAGVGGVGGAGTGAAGSGAGSSWQSFEVSTGSAFVGSTTRLLDPNGLISVTDNTGTKASTLDPQDRNALLQILDDGEFLAAMQSGFACPMPPQDVGVSFSLTLGSGQVLTQAVTGCVFASGTLAGPSQQARTAFELVSKY